MCFQSACGAVEKTFRKELTASPLGTRRADERIGKAWREAAQRAEESA